jgi:hypothetical protein
MPKPLLAALAALLLLPSAAAAERVTFGSDLSGTPDVMDNKHQADFLSFNVGGRNSHGSPVSGQILEVRVKGAIIPKGSGKQDMNLFHTQVLTPNPDGTFKVELTSGHQYFPVGGRPTDVHSWNTGAGVMCIQKGQYVNFNHIGGWDGDPSDPRGTQYQIWKNDQSSQLYWYEEDNGTNNGTVFTPNRQVNGHTDAVVTSNPQNGRPYPRELMMQVVVGTGFDSTKLCQGGLKGYEYAGVDVIRQKFTVNDDGVAGARVACSSGRGFCEGTLRLESDGVVLGQSPFHINRSITTNIDIPLTSEGARLVNRRKQLDTTVVADSQDDIGQRRQTRGVSVLKAARPGGGFPGTQLRKQSTKAKGSKFSIRATCPRASFTACTGKVVVSSQKRIGGRFVKFGSGRYSIESGKVARFPVKLTAKGKKALRRVRRAVAIAVVTSRDASGGRKKERSKITLKR